MPPVLNLNNQAISILSDIDQAKKDIAAAINTKGGNSTPNESFQQLADDIENLNDSFITYGVTVDPKINWLDFICNKSIESRRSLLEIDDNLITRINANEVFINSINLFKVNFRKLEVIDGGRMFIGCSSLNIFIAEKLNTIVGYNLGNSPFRDVPLKNFICPRLTNTSANALFYGFNLPITNIVIGKLNSINLFYNNILNLRNITIGQDTDIDLPFQLWIATNVIYEGQSGIDELNANLYNNLLTKLYDHSQDGQTRTLRIGWLANVSEDNIAYATAKGWTLTT